MQHSKAQTPQSPLVSAEEVHKLSRGANRPVLLDVRWSLGDADGHAHYLAGHLPRAVFVDLEAELSAPGTPQGGRHPLPDPRDFQATARSWGINENSEVVVYDATNGLAAARAWWLLRHAGFARVRVLDGGLGAWERSGYGLDIGVHSPEPGNVELGWDRMPVIDIDAAANFQGQLLDARAHERYTGATEPIDSRAGHIPGALSRPTTENLDGTGRLLNPEELAASLKDAGIDPDAGPVAAYCGSGVTAAHQILALETMGIHAALFPGSWSQYSADPTRTPATGENP